MTNALYYGDNIDVLRNEIKDRLHLGSIDGIFDASPLCQFPRPEATC